MSTITLHRGITVPGDVAIQTMGRIDTDGIAGTEGKWNLRVADPHKVRRRIDALFTKPNLTVEDIEFDDTPGPGPWICACGTELGARYYATRHNMLPGEREYPIVVEFTAPIDDVCVDPRDFLCTAFQLWDRDSADHRQAQADVLTQLFGPAIRRYFSAASIDSSQDYRIAMCNLAATDEAVVEGHLMNTKVIGGRYNTRFKSAFFLKAPIAPERIIRVRKPRYQVEDLKAFMKPDIDLEDFIKLGKL